eukprot:9032621-Lingulodinium_polyedra.AAC.1
MTSSPDAPVPVGRWPDAERAVACRECEHGRVGRRGHRGCLRAACLQEERAVACRECGHGRIARVPCAR